MKKFQVKNEITDEVLFQSDDEEEREEFFENSKNNGIPVIRENKKEIMEEMEGE